MNKRPTIKTIAQIAGISHVAVSRALRDCSDISEETKEKVRRIADEIGYSPNAAARALSSRHTRVIGMIVPDMGEKTAYNPVFNEISLAAAEKGYSVMLGSCHRSIDIEKKQCRIMVENNVGALIAASCTSDISHIKSICRDRIPVIFIGGKTDPNEKCALLMNFRHSAELAVEHLYSLGHRDIALFAYYPDNRTIQQKENGFIDSMEKRGLIPRVYKEGMSSDTLSAGRILVRKLLREKSLPTAIWCASDLMAIGVINELNANGLSVPDDVSVIGHDDLYFDIFPNISLTTIHIPMKELGQAAAKLAIDYIDDNVQQDETHREFETELVIRATTAKPKK